MPRPTVTRMVEDYVTLIWKAYEWPGGEPTTSDLAAQLSVTPSTVSANLKKLARDGFIEYEAYGSIELTDAGREIAVALVRRHRLLETYLVQQLGLSWDQVHDEADQLEHAVSDLVLDRMDDVLGHPAVDPHGDPIPAADGTIAPDSSMPLLDAEPGAAVTVARVSDRSPELLRYLETHGFVVGAALAVTSRTESADVVHVEVAGSTIPLSLQAAGAIRVVRA